MKSEIRNRAPLPKVSDDHESASRLDSMPNALTPLMVNNSHGNVGSSTNDIQCECILPQESIARYNYDENGVDIFNQAKSESY
jgi:hypothetical protein